MRLELSDTWVDKNSYVIGLPQDIDLFDLYLADHRSMICIILKVLRLEERAIFGVKLRREQTISLLNKRDIEFYKSQYKFLHIGMVQIVFKPLTLKGLPETFLAALRSEKS
ncbi:hypothetical protein H5410_008657 [Solanum commersonii]|uniref:Uncharacterized protein n=1 Tax=Solanum commersonii TaxID=4109 RepID=A0A9J6AHD8_SOLCO|nr:hypothetical protein H5410_008657 [Solanum commersonii]